VERYCRKYAMNFAFQSEKMEKKNMNRDKEFEEFALKYERKKSDRERWVAFEHALRYLLCELKDKTDRKDDFLLDNVKQAVIVYVMKDRFAENNGIFLNNIKNDFYNAIQKLEEKHTDIQSRTWTIKLFMEDFYFEKQS